MGYHSGWKQHADPCFWHKEKDKGTLSMTTTPVSKRKRKAPKRHQALHPRVDKTTTFDTMTREALMYYREEEAQRMKAEG